MNGVKLFMPRFAFYFFLQFMKITPRLTCLLSVFFASTFAAHAAETTAWINFNKNGKKDLCEALNQSIERLIDDLLTQMNVTKKTFQLNMLNGDGRVLKDPLPA